MKTMLTFLSLTGLCSIMDLYSVPRIETFFWYDFDTSFLSKLYAINHYPRAPGVPDNYAHIRQFMEDAQGNESI